MSPVTNVTGASSSGVMIRAQAARVAARGRSATTGTPSRTSSRTVHAPMQPSAPVTRNRSSRARSCAATAGARTGRRSRARPIRSISTVDLVAVAEEPRRLAEHADAAGRAGRDDVAGLEGERLRAVADDLGDPEVHLRRCSRPGRRSPPTMQQIARSCGSPISSAVTRAGPIGQNVSSDLPRTHWPSPNWMSRAETSLRQV